jgi:hypothetical protein
VAAEPGDRGTEIGAQINRHQPPGNIKSEKNNTYQRITNPVAQGRSPLLGLSEQPTQWGNICSVSHDGLRRRQCSLWVQVTR